MQVTNHGLLAAGVLSMVNSGNLGGNPVFSKPGIASKTGNLCLSNEEDNLRDKPENDFGKFDIKTVP